MGAWGVRGGVDVKEVRGFVGKGFGVWGEIVVRNPGQKVRGYNGKD